jgi:hypothetical protein
MEDSRRRSSRDETHLRHSNRAFAPFFSRGELYRKCITELPRDLLASSAERAFGEPFLQSPLIPTEIFLSDAAHNRAQRSAPV